MADYDDGQQRSPFLVPPLPEEVIRNSRTTDHRVGGGTENVVEAPERVAAREAIDTLEADHQRAMDAKLAHDEATAHINEQAANAQVALADQQQAERDRAYKATQPGIDEWKTRLRESMDRFDKLPAPKLFAGGETTTENVLKAVGLVFAGLGDAITTRALITAGHAPTGKNSVSDIIDADLARQRESAQRLSDRIVMARTGLNDANAARAQLLAEVDQRGAVAYKRADLIAKARLAGTGMDAAKIEATLEQLGFRQKTQELKQASVAPLINRTTTSTQDATGTEYSHTQNVNKPPSGGQTRPANVNDFEGKPVGQAPAGEAEAVNKDTLGRKKAIEALEVLRDASKDGRRHLPTDDDYSEYVSKVRDAQIQIAAISPLGKTDEAMKLEAATLGPDGRGVFSVDPKIYDRLIGKVKKDAESSWKIHNSRPSDQEIAQVRGAPSRMDQPGSAAPPTNAPPTAAAAESPEARKERLKQTWIKQLRRNPATPGAYVAKGLYGITDKDIK